MFSRGRTTLNVVSICEAPRANDPSLYDLGTALIAVSETVTIVNRMLNRVADKEYIAENIDAIITYPDLADTYWAYYDILEASNWHDHKIENNVELWTEVFVGE